MAVGRMLAGPVVRRLSSIGLLIGASCFSAVGLFLLSLAGSPIGAFLAATAFTVGICDFWPTMLGATSERFPDGGALSLGIIGGAGNLSVALVLPIMGKIYDTKGPEMALRYIVVLPVFLILLLGAVWLNDRAQGANEGSRRAERIGRTGGSGK
jgi:predicted MFS family arabinose efflux permease